MRRWLVGLAVLAALVGATRSALAADGDSAPKWAGGIYLFTQDAPVPSVLTGGVSPSTGIVGLGYEMNGRWGGSSHWGWNGSFGYGIGGIKDKQSDITGSSEDEITFTHWQVRLGMDYWNDCCDEEWYCGPGLIYMSTGGTLKSTGSPDFDLEPMKVIGLDSRVGGQMKMGARTRLFGGMSMMFGRSSWEQTESGTKFEENGWVTSYSYRGGIRWNY